MRIMNTLEPLICESKWTLMHRLIVDDGMRFHLVCKSLCQQSANVNLDGESRWPEKCPFNSHYSVTAVVQLHYRFIPQIPNTTI